MNDKQNKFKGNTQINNNDYQIKKVEIKSYVIQNQNISKINIKNIDNNIKNIDNNSKPESGQSSMPNLNKLKNNELIQCPQSTFNIDSEIRKFIQPLTINKCCMSYIKINQLRDSKRPNYTELSRPKKNIAISTSNIFIGGGQNLKGMRIHLSNSCKKNNTSHKEVTVLKKNRNKSVESVEINLSEDYNKKIMECLNLIRKRWKDCQKISKMNMSYIPKNTINLLSKKRYINDIVNKTKLSKKNDNKDYFLLIKQDINDVNNGFVHEVISPTSNEDLEKSINNFIDKNSDNGSKVLKNKSKFNTINLDEKENLNDNFTPFLLLDQSKMNNFYEIIEKQYKQMKKSINSMNTGSSKQTKKVNIKTSLEDINSNLYPIKVDKFEFKNNNSNVKGLYSSFGNKIMNNKDMKMDKTEVKYIKEPKKMKDFGQVTPISLIQEKYFIYAVSKWAKYSVINPQERLLIKYSYKNGHPKFDPICLYINNFTLWIEKIKSNKNISNNSVSINNYLKNSKNGSGKNKDNKQGISNSKNNNNDYINNKIIKKKSGSKPKVEKKDK